MTVLVLDLDGVVVLGHPDGVRWDQHLQRDLGIDPARLQSHFFRTHWPRIDIGEVDLFEALEQAWPDIDTRATITDLVDYWFAKDSRLDRDVLAHVDAWRATGRKAFLATVQEHHRAQYLWNELHLARHFDALLYSAALGARKPDPAFYERAAAEIGVPPGDLVFLDDRPENVAAAITAGWRATLHRDAADLARAIAAA